MSPLLEVRNARKRFGALAVTDDVSLTVLPGETHALIGPNGAGKSCLIGEITGELALDGGEIHFCGGRIDRLPVHARARGGLIRAYQVPQFFVSRTVRENVMIPEISRTRSGWRFWRRASADPALAGAADACLEHAGLAPLAERPSAALAHGEKRELELAMGFAARPRLLLLDEPLAGLGPGDSGRMIARLQALKGRYAMLLIEHDVQAVFLLADRISVLVAGRIIASGSPDEIRGNALVRSAYLGEGIA
jgi:branched-chain amino acid transport system ATP-binding protein